MSTVTIPSPANSRSISQESLEHQRLIDARIESTRRGLKLVDLASTLVILAVMSLGYLLTTAVIEHWLFSHGMPTALRAILLVVFAAFLLAYLWRRVAPLVLHKINPAFAADTIERENPSLKNSLLSFLQLRSQTSPMPRAVLEAVEEQAARSLSARDIETAIDRSSLIRAGSVLAALMLIAVMYTVVSPKSLMTSAARVLLPWADIAAPSRVQITRIAPGDAQLVQGDQLEVSASVTKLAANESVELIILPESGDSYRVPMHAGDDGNFTALLPSDGADALLGLQQSFGYRIAAGDAESTGFSVIVDPAPTLRVTTVDYDFPAYTGYVDRTVEGLADLRAVEGTQVRITAEANSEIATAHIDFAADGRNDLSMQVDGTRATASFVMELPSDGTPPPKSYTLRLKTVAGATNRQPPVHSMEVIADLPPEIELTAPEAKIIEVAADEQVTIGVEGRDPDFALSRVAVRMVKADGTEIDPHEMIERAHRGRFNQEFTFTPAELALKSGDVVNYWAIADDNRTPNANTSETDRQELRVIGPANGEQQQQGNPKQGDPQQGEPGQGDPQNGEGQPNEGQPNEGQTGNEGGGEGQPGQSGDQAGDQANEGGQAGDNADGVSADRENAEGQPGNEGGAGGAGESSQDGNQGESGDQNPGEQSPEGGAEQGMSEKGGEGGEQGNSGGQQGNSDGNQTGEQQPGQNGSGQQSQDNPGKTNQNQSEGQGGDQPGEPNGNQSGDPSANPGQGGQGGGDASQPSKPVASDGSDDASAIDKIRRHLSDEERKNSTQRSSDVAPENADGERQPGDETPAGAAAKPKGSGEQSTGQKPESKEPSGQGDPEAGSEATEGAGAEQPGTKDKSASGETSSTSAESDTDPEAGNEPGGGDSTGEENSGGSPEAQRDATAREKTPEGDTPERQGEDAAQSPGTSKNESDSRGEQRGDQEGGGTKGGGQQAPREGTGSDGQNQAADEGAGRSADEGPGETGNEGGDGPEADGETGTAGEQPGEGSETQTGGEKPGGESQPGQAGQGEQGDPNSMKSSPNAAPGSMPTGGDGGPIGGDAVPAGGEALAGDEANLDYAREQTDLMLEELSDQLDKQKVDEQMLDELGWTEGELRSFVDRWKTRKQAAETGDAAAQVELDEALRSIGLKSGTIAGETNRTTDENRNFSEGTNRAVPSKYRDRLKWYTESLNRSRD